MINRFAGLVRLRNWHQAYLSLQDGMRLYDRHNLDGPQMGALTRAASEDN